MRTVVVLSLGVLALPLIAALAVYAWLRGPLEAAYRQRTKGIL